MLITINGKHMHERKSGRYLHKDEKEMNWTIDVPEELKNSPLTIQLNVADGGGATINVCKETK